MFSTLPVIPGVFSRGQSRKLDQEWGLTPAIRNPQPAWGTDGDTRYTIDQFLTVYRKETGTLLLLITETFVYDKSHIYVQFLYTRLYTFKK